MKAGFVVQRLNGSQQAYKLCQTANAMVMEDLVDIIVFHDEWDISPIDTAFMMLQKQHMWSYEGILVATDIRSAEQVLKSPGPSKKYFYLWNLEWLYIPGFTNARLSNVYQNPDLDLIVRSTYHADLVTKCWKKPVSIIEDFDKNEFTKIFTR